MNRVMHFSRDNEFDLEQSINDFAKKREIINVSYAYDSRTSFNPYKALVLYKWK